METIQEAMRELMRRKKDIKKTEKQSIQFNEEEQARIRPQEKIKKFFKGDSRYFDKAADIIVEWYEIENNIEMLRRPTLDDILDLLNASSYEKESVIIAKAIGPKAKFAFPTFNGKDISEYGDEYLTEDLEQAKNESLLPDL